jgi:iron complex transport system substrate-binding protein
VRIVSLLPSATEMVCLLGLEDRLVGVTHECDFPPSVAGLPPVTRSAIPNGAASGDIDRLVRERVQHEQSIYTLDIEGLQALRPDLIITQALCEVCAVPLDDVQEAVCRLPGPPHVVNLEPTTLDQVFDAVGQVAEAAGVPERAGPAIEPLRLRVEAVTAEAARRSWHPRVAFLEWLEPPFCAGHWNPELIRLAGGIDPLGKEGEPSRTVSWEAVVATEPDVVFIACCGFDVERTLIDVERLATVAGWNDLAAVREGRVHIADGSQYFNRPGPRLVDSLEMLARAFGTDGPRHPE